jgi:cell division cycle 2-like protein
LSPSKIPSNIDKNELMRVVRKKSSSKYDIKNSELVVSNEEKETLLKKRKLCGLIEGCDSIENYIHLNKIHEGVYGIVFRARDKITDEIFAIKKVKLNKDNKEGFPITSIREINILLALSHPNIVHLKEVVVGSSLDKIYVVMEYMEHELKDLMDH